MKNKHLEHPEDSILLGKDSALNVINFLAQKNSKLTVKYDGAPAIIFGSNPENGKFFVGTKSVFNKKKIKINYNHFDIAQNHDGKVAEILHVAYQCLPRIAGVVQGDFIGFGGNDFYKPNTIEYQFDLIVQEDFIFAAHTSYTGDNLKDAVAHFEVPALSSEKVKFLSVDADIFMHSVRVQLLCVAAKLLTRFISFPDAKQAAQAKITINSYIRRGEKLNPWKLAMDTDCDARLFRLYNLIAKIKELLMENVIADDNVRCFIDNKESTHEGYVMTNQFGTFKLVNRREFSYNNFNLPKDW